MRGKPGSAPGKYGYQPAFHVAWARRISHAELGKATGYSASMVRFALRGCRKPSKQLVERMSEFLRLPPEALFTDEVRP